MSNEQEGAPEAVAAQQQTRQDSKQQVPPEFIERMNQFLRLANRLERRYDTQHATLVFLNAFARYSAHNYLSKVQEDTPEERQAYLDYIGRFYVDMTRRNMDDILRFGREVEQHRERLRAERAAGAANADATGATGAE